MLALVSFQLLTLLFGTHSGFPHVLENLENTGNVLELNKIRKTYPGKNIAYEKIHLEQKES